MEEPDNLYALSAVLMDGDSGRVLYEKDGEVPRANASTTKVLTCILALENAPGDDYVTVSANAASQPDVQLGMKAGEQYYLEDLLYSLMLKSHNDTAVAIAEHVGGSVENFSRMMDEKAKQIGCTDTHFITPNGLDARDSQGFHHTTARDLALIMRYAVENETFLRITRTMDYSFTDLSKKRQFSVHNANALLTMLDGVLSGKTGFTGNAGYCYVCACERNGRIFIISLLGCGWPNNKSYKWSDTKKLLKYGEDNYEYRSFFKKPQTGRVLVKDGAPAEDEKGQLVWLKGIVRISENDRKKEVLMRKDEEISCRVSMPESISAPVTKNSRIGEISYYLGKEKLAAYPVLAEKSVKKIDYFWYVDRVFHAFFH